jgi:putative PEP-CTERM system TPR-repeat lipoprotein
MDRIQRSTALALATLIGLAVAGCGRLTPDDHLARGNAHADQNRLPEALIEYRLGLQADEQRSDIRLKLADTLLRSRDGSGALKEYVRAADQRPQDIQAQLKAGGLLLLAGAFDDAKLRANRVLALDPSHVEGTVLLGNALAGLQDLDGALTQYREAIVLNPSLDTAYASIGAIQSARGQKGEAEATFRRAIQAAPKSAAARMALANFLWAERRIDEAEQVLKDTVKTDPADVSANRALGMFYLASGKPAAAEPHFVAIADAVKTTDATVSLADYYVLTRRMDDARRLLTDVAKKDDGFAVATVRMAAIDAMQGRSAEAVARVQTVLDKHPKDVPARLLFARLLFAENKRDEALTEVQNLLKAEPPASSAAEGYLLMGAIHGSRDRFDEAIRAYEEVVKRQSQPIGAQLALSSLHFDQGALDKAEGYARQVLALQPKNPLARVQLVRIHLSRRQGDLANSELASLEREFPDAPPILNLAAARHVAEGRAQQARAAYLRALNVAANDLDALGGLVSLDIAAGRKADAVARLDAALKRMPPSTSLLTMSGRAFAAAGDVARAEALLKQAIDLDPTRLVAYGLLGQLYMAQKRLPDAESQFRQLLTQNSRSMSANTMLGMILEAQGRVPEAEQQYQKTLGIDPTAPVAANNLAWIYVAGNRNLDEALQLAQTAYQKLPDNPNVNDTLGWIYYKKNLAPLAIRYLEASLKHDNSDPSVHYHLGMAYLQAGTIDKGRKALQDSLASGRQFDGAAEAKAALSRFAPK